MPNTREPTVSGINDPTFLRRVNELRRTDNFTNWYYLLREYLYLAMVIGLTITFYQFRADWGLSWWWNVPLTLVSIALIGAGQHRLTTLAHEGSHYLLFRHRLLNELVSDVFCLFPMWSTTYQYRLQHMAHHQFPNDPGRDPDLTQLEASGHRFQFPMSPGRFLWECVIKQILWVPGLIRYTRMRARFAATGGGSGPYRSSGGRPKLLVLAGLIYLALQVGALTLLTLWAPAWTFAVVPPLLLAGIVAFFLLVPAHYYRKSLVKSDVSARWTTVFRMVYLTLVFTALAGLTRWTGMPWGLYYIVLWLVPIGTSFSFCMLLRQVVQHGNATRERFSNTRVFLVSPLIRFAVFPLGMDYHLPHHLFPLVPHYALRQLHQLLLQTEEYRNEATVVEGYFFHRTPPENATVVELMATPREGAASPVVGRDGLVLQ